ncbi:MAG: hypothetical protein JW862_03960 [Anaerolineales bacterium]|nr:hypothetical protein [Anaerolineales bacterium]
MLVNLLVVASIILLCCIGSSLVAQTEDLWLMLLFGAAVLIFGLLVYPRLLRWLRRRTQASQPDAATVMAKDSRPPVFYLRSFREDGSRDQGVIFVWFPFPTYLPKPTYEEQIAPYFKRIGPFVTLSAANFGPPELGASRLMTDDANWQQSFLDLIRRCSLVVFRAGDSQSLIWELNQLIRRVDPRKVIIYLQIGDDADRAVQQARYARFVGLTTPIFPLALPAVRGNNMYLYFESAWEPVLAKSLNKVLKAKGF